MPKVFLVNPRRSTSNRSGAGRSMWDRGAVHRVIKASGFGDLFGKGGSMRRRHSRRNPSMGGGMLWTVGGAAGGFLFTGTIASMVAPSGALNYVASAAVALGGGWLLGRWKKPVGTGWVVGGLASLAIKLYQSYTGASSSPGTSFYAAYNAPFNMYDTGNPLSLPAYAPGGSSTLPVGTSPTTAAMVKATGGNYTPRLTGRFSQ